MQLRQEGCVFLSICW